MVTRRKQSLRRKFKHLDLDTIDPEQPWRYNPELDEDERYEVFKTIESPFTQSMEEVVYFPDDRELPKEGSWVWCIRPPAVLEPPSFGAVYFAKPYPDGVKGFRNMRYSILAFTEHGEVRLWPYEYAHPKIEEVIEFWAEGDLEFVPFEGMIEQEMTERLFYVQSRGIPPEVAMPMVLGDIKRPVGWFRLNASPR